MGTQSLLANEYGRPRPGRKALADRLFRRENVISTKEYAAILDEELSRAKCVAPVAVESIGGGTPFGVISRTGKTADARKTLLLANVLKTSVKVKVPGKWNDVLAMEPVSGIAELTPGAVRLLVAPEK